MEYEIFISKKPVDGRSIEEIRGKPVVRPIQVHGSRVIFANRFASEKKGDAIVTDSKRWWIGVLCADCLPVFLISDDMVGVVHAGWRGTSQGITYKAAKYINTFAKVKRAILAPCICERCYRVGYDVYHAFPSTQRDKFFIEEGNGFYFDLKRANILQLKAAGIRDIEIIPGCTVCNNDVYYSFRKEKTEKRTLYAIRLV
jgi:YfiH family protein